MTNTSTVISPGPVLWEFSCSIDDVTPREYFLSFLYCLLNHPIFRSERKSRTRCRSRKSDYRFVKKLSRRFELPLLHFTSGVLILSYLVVPVPGQANTSFLILSLLLSLCNLIFYFLGMKYNQFSYHFQCPVLTSYHFSCNKL